MAHVDPMERVFGGLALLSTIAVVFALQLSPVKMQPPPPDPPPASITVTLEAAAPEPPAPPAAPPKAVTPPPPPPQVRETQPARPVIPVPRKVAPKPPTPQPEKVAEAPAETPPPVPQPVAAPPKPAAPAANVASEEAGYVGRLRAYIRSITQYPTSGQARRERPEGSTEVRFVLNRAGQVQDASIEQGSGSPILDKQALSIVKGGTYPAMPHEVWSDAPEHVFTVTVVFTAP